MELGYLAADGSFVNVNTFGETVPYRAYRIDEAHVAPGARGVHPLTGVVSPTRPGPFIRPSPTLVRGEKTTRLESVIL